MNIIEKDILTVKSGAIVHQVNMQGIMGGGLALAIRQKWPVVYRAYLAELHAFTLGHIQCVSVSSFLGVVNLCGQDGFGTDKRYTDYDALRHGLEMIALIYHSGNFPESVYLPYGIGCGLGGGDWEIVSGIIEEVIPEAIICKREG